VRFTPILFLIILISPQAFAQDSESDPIEYTIATSLVSIGEIDKKIGTYELDFWYSIFAEGYDMNVRPPPEVDFVNGKNEEISSQYLASNIYEQRVRGTFVNTMDFHDFPFEKIKLKVDIEPVTPWNTDRVILKVDPASGVDETANVPGWFVTDPTFTVIEKTYRNSGETYSRYTAEFTIERSPLGSFLKIVFPVLIVLTISFVAYIIPENFEVSAALALLPLIAVVFLHINALDQLPALGYLTVYDKMMIIVYAMIANNVISTGREIRQNVYHGKQQSRQINQFHLRISPVIAIVLTIFLFTLV
tara:strand:+ start:394 stop:1308 length:915 start_codon:yes stop_codon:yes gene_type:complete